MTYRSRKLHTGSEGGTTHHRKVCFTLKTLDRNTYFLAFKVGVSVTVI